MLLINYVRVTRGPLTQFCVCVYVEFICIQFYFVGKMTSVINEEILESFWPGFLLLSFFFLFGKECRQNPNIGHIGHNTTRRVKKNSVNIFRKHFDLIRYMVGWFNNKTIHDFTMNGKLGGFFFLFSLLFIVVNRKKKTCIGSMRLGILTSGQSEHVE